MFRGIRRARAMTSATTPEINRLIVQVLSIEGRQNSRWVSNRQDHAERDHRQVTVEQDRAVDSRQGADLFDDSFGLGQESVVKKLTERKVDASAGGTLG